MVNTDTLAELEKLGFGADVDALETYVGQLQDAAAMGKPIVTDPVYDHHIKLLKQLKPESELLHRNWESEETPLTEYDALLKQYGMCSIETITEYKELYKFKAVLDAVGHPVELMAAMKKNGHGVRAVYLNGYIYNGSTRGRYKKGREIPRHLKMTLPNYVEAWRNIPIVEVRGEMLVKISTFEEHLKNILKTPLSSVTSLIKDSASDSEIKMLNMVCYKVIASDDSLKFNTLWEEYEHLKENGFEIPHKAKIEGVTSANVEKAITILLGYFEKLMDEREIEYLCDGFVVAINDTETFYSMGKNGNSWKSNIAIKMGKYWESNIYDAVIQDVVFMPGKSYMTPKAIIEPTKAANGSEVTTVPLYNIGVMERYGYVPGATIYYRYGGEMGVTLCDIYGDSVRVNG